MGYQTGSAADASALRSALIAFAVAQGWTWDATNEMLYKGAVYAKLTVPTSTSLRIQGATGYSGATLTNPTASWAEIRDLAASPTVTKAIVWPVTYHILANASPDDLVLLINFDTSYWEWLGLGQCTDLGVGPSGKATWCGASMPAYGIIRIKIGVEGGGVNAYYRQHPCAPFWANDVTAGGNADPAGTANTWVHSALDGSDSVVRQWVNDNNALLGQYYRAATPLLARQPNAWNEQTLLVPARIVASRPSGFYSYVAEMPHARLLRMDNLEGGDLITLGSDQWFVAPFFRKNPVAQTESDSGNSGWAIRYTP